jgi:hypothetical protein
MRQTRIFRRLGGASSERHKWHRPSLQPPALSAIAGQWAYFGCRRVRIIGARDVLCEAATSLLKARRMRIAERTSKMCAIIAVTRKLAAIMYRLN